MVLLEPRLDGIHEGNDILFPSIGKIGGHATRTDVVVVHAKASDLLKEPQYRLAFTPAVNDHRDRTEIKAVGGHEQQVRGDPVQLGHEHADPRGSCRNFQTEQLLGSERERQFGEQRRRVIHPGDVGAALKIRQVLAGLFHAGVEIANDGLGTKDRLALHLQHQAKHAVSRRVRRPHVDDHLGIADVVGGV